MCDCGISARYNQGIRVENFSTSDCVENFSTSVDNFYLLLTPRSDSKPVLSPAQRGSAVFTAA